MSVVFLRARSADPEEQKMPALAEVYQQMGKAWPCRSEFLKIRRHLFERAEAEMTEARRQQGYSQIARAAIPERNFMLCGQTVVCGDD